MAIKLNEMQYKTVLVISDMQEEFELTASFLRKEGHRVLFQRKLTSTDTFEVDPPNLLICELAAPDIDGPKICRQVRDTLSQQKTPVLLVGDLSKESSIVTESFECGATNYLQKPVDSSELAHLCRKMLESEENMPSHYVSDHLCSVIARCNIRDFKWEIREDLISTN